MDSRVIGVSAGILVIAAAAGLVLRGQARIVDVRVGYHDRYDRVVVELSRAVDIVRRPETRWRDLIVDLDASPRERSIELQTDSPRVGALVLEETPSGARLSSTRRERRLRLFRLDDPPRLVVDFADPDNMVLSAPQGAWAVPTYSPEGPELAYTSAAADAEAEAEAGGEPILEPSDAGSEGTSAGPPATPARRAWLHWLLGLPVAVGLAVLGALGVRNAHEAWRRLRVTSHRVPWISPSTTAPPGEPLGDALLAPADLLARRHDEEVSARMQLEERVQALQEEVRQLRAGLTRLARRSEDRA